MKHNYATAHRDRCKTEPAANGTGTDKATRARSPAIVEVSKHRAPHETAHNKAERGANVIQGPVSGGRYNDAVHAQQGLVEHRPGEDRAERCMIRDADWQKKISIEIRVRHVLVRMAAERPQNAHVAVLLSVAFNILALLVFGGLKNTPQARVSATTGCEAGEKKCHKMPRLGDIPLPLFVATLHHWACAAAMLQSNNSATARTNPRCSAEDPAS